MSAERNTSREADLHFYFDPVCPFAWMTSKWVRMVADQRDYSVEWRFISLRLINSSVDYDDHFPPGYDAGHTAGLRLLRLAAKARADHGQAVIGPLYAALGARIFDGEQSQELDGAARGTSTFVAPILRELGLPADLLDVLDSTALDAELQAETDQALALTGKDVGTPIIHFRPPTGVAFFGPVISRLPSEEEAAPLWDNVLGLASFPGFAELKRSLRERPQLRSFGVDADVVGTQEDWHAGSRRTSI
ncbi:MAG: hypothetical protein ACR2LX_09805 [Jatrophihabitans sp.]